MPIRLAAVIGSVTPPGRLNRAVTEALGRAAGPDVSVEVIDLGGYRLDFADGRPVDARSDDSPRLVTAIEGADAVLLATPIYRATLTGALKNALDLLPLSALQSRPVAIVSMGATPHHFLGAESHLRDILAWFGAWTLPTAVYLSSADFEDRTPRPEAAASLDALVQALLSLATAKATLSAGPPPLAAGKA